MARQADVRVPVGVAATSAGPGRLPRDGVCGLTSLLFPLVANLCTWLGGGGGRAVLCVGFLVCFLKKNNQSLKCCRWSRVLSSARNSECGVGLGFPPTAEGAGVTTPPGHLVHSPADRASLRPHAGRVVQAWQEAERLSRAGGRPPGGHWRPHGETLRRGSRPAGTAGLGWGRRMAPRGERPDGTPRTPADSILSVTRTGSARLGRALGSGRGLHLSEADCPRQLPRGPRSGCSGRGSVLPPGPGAAEDTRATTADHTHAP